MAKVSFRGIGVSLLLAVVVLASFASPLTAAPVTQDDPQARADALFNEGVDLYYLADYQGALEKFEAALALYREIGNRAGKGSTLNNMGLCYENLGRYDQALDCYEQALIILREMGDRGTEAFTLNNIGMVYDDLGQYEQALAYYQQALSILRDIGDRATEAGTLNNIAVSYKNLSQYEEALDYYQQALALAQEMGDQAREGATLMNMGVVYYELGQYETALDLLEQALVIKRATGDRAGEGMALTNIGNVYDSLAQYQQALDYFQQGLAIEQDIGTRAGEAMALTNIGIVHGELGQYEEALDFFEQALTTFGDIGHRAGVAATLNNIGLVHDHSGAYEEALESFQQALAIAREIGDRDGEGGTLTNIATVHDHLGQYQQALDYYEQALAIKEEIGDRGGEGSALSGIGNVYRWLGEHEDALQYLQRALAITQELGDRDGEAGALANVGNIYYDLGDYAQALDYYGRALDMLREVGARAREGMVLQAMAYAYGALGQSEDALDYYQQALSIEQEVGDRSGEASSLRMIGEAYEDGGDAAQAISYYQQAIEVTESIQSQMQTEELQTSYAAEQVPVYERLIGLLWQEDRLEEAFNYGERGRARAFLDQLAGGRVDFRSGAAAGLLDQEAEAKDQIAAQRGQLVSLRNRPQDEWDTETIAAVESELTTLESDYAALLTQIKLQSPEAASLVSVDVASLSDIQGALGADTTLLEYFVTEERTLVFILTQDTYETESLDVSREELADTITTFRDFASLEDPHPASLQQLHTWLIAPIEAHLETSMVGIVPHGVLHYLPFAALTDGERYLGEEYVLFSLPSASALTFIQEKRKDGADTLLALGSPTIAEALPVLQFAEGEVETIADLYETEALVGAEATESAVWSQATGAGILHLAAHGSYNAYNPLFSAVHLAEDGENDGRLEVHEVYGLDLTESTDLVVLSACQTQMGALSAGDEVVGLTRAFLYAGTPSVIASLWGVDDQATALLMERFYTHLQAGVGKGEALRQAQMDVRAEYPHPYYWAAFVLTGDAGEVTQATGPAPTAGGGGPCWGAALPVGLVMLVGFRRHRGFQVVKPSTVGR